MDRVWVSPHHGFMYVQITENNLRQSSSHQSTSAFIQVGLQNKPSLNHHLNAAA